MPKINRSILVNYTADQMYHLVNAFEEYPEFLPWCNRATMRRIGDHAVEGTIYFSHGIINKSFTTLNTLEPNQSIHMQLVEGPFRKFEGTWRFDQPNPAIETCQLTFDLEFEFTSPMVAMAAGPIFQTAIGSMIDAFVKRAESIYA